MDFQSFLASAQVFVKFGIQYGLLTGLLVGGITWAILNYPEYLFRAVFGLFLGLVIAGLIYAPLLAQNFRLLRAAAGGPMPQGTVRDIIDLLLKMGIGALAGALLTLLISAPRETILGILFGTIAGIFLGGLVVTILPGIVDPRYYPAIVGLLTMVVFVVFGSV